MKVYVVSKRTGVYENQDEVFGVFDCEKLAIKYITKNGGAPNKTVYSPNRCKYCQKEEFSKCECESEIHYKIKSYDINHPVK